MGIFLTGSAVLAVQAHGATVSRTVLLSLALAAVLTAFAAWHGLASHWSRRAALPLAGGYQVLAHTLFATLGAATAPHHHEAMPAHGSSAMLAAHSAAAVVVALLTCEGSRLFRLVWRVIRSVVAVPDRRHRPVPRLRGAYAVPPSDVRHRLAVRSAALVRGPPALGARG